MKPARGHDERALPVDYVPVAEPDATLPDDTLLNLLDDLVEEPGRVAAAHTLGVNQRALAFCGDSRQVSRRTRLGLVDCRHAGWFAR